MEIFGTGLAVGTILGFGISRYLCARSETEENGEDDEVPDPSAFALRMDDVEYKVVLCVRNDLKMGKGKIGAQCRCSSLLHTQID